MKTELRAAILTLGCKVNHYESQAMAELLENAGYQMVPFTEMADVYIVNTCTVTEVAAKKSRQMIHRARTLNPEACVVAAGCYSERDDAPKALLEAPEGERPLADFLLLNKEKGDLIERLNAWFSAYAAAAERTDLTAAAAAERTDLTAAEVLTANEESKAKQPSNSLFITNFEGKTRAVMKVQDGCRQFCTYCLIPYVRGPLQSRPVEECVREAKGLAQAGFKEIVVTGIHLSSYGLDWKDEVYNRTEFPGDDLAALIHELGQIPGIERIRLGSLEPRLISDEWVEKVKNEKKLCPHFHLSLQSGGDKVLKEMNRQYTAEDFRQAVRRLREAFPDVAITTDVIAGFAGETEEDHQASLEFVREMQFAEAHIFRYSRMKGTAAYGRKDQVSQELKKRRSEELLAVTAESTEAFMQSMQGREADVLLETPADEEDRTGAVTAAAGENAGGRVWIGTTPNYVRVAIELPEGGDDARGTIVKAVISGYYKAGSANHAASGLERILKGTIKKGDL